MNHFPRDLHIHRLWLISELVKQPFDSLLDVGCGKGLNLYYFKQVWPDATYAGIDIVATDIHDAQERDPDIDFKVASVTSLPYPDKSFDVITSDGVLMYVPKDEMPKAVSELRRVARKAIILCEQHAPEGTVGRAELRDLAVFGPDLEFVRGTTDWGDPSWVEYGCVARLDLLRQNG